MRPKAPYQYATLVPNYPAGGNPWSGLSVRVAPAADYWTPGTAKAAENYNYEIGSISDDNVALYNYLSQLSAVNWSPLYPVSTVQNATSLMASAPVYNAAIGLWMMGIGRGSAPTSTIVFSPNGSSYWASQSGFSMPSLTNMIDSIAVNPANGNAVAISVGGRHSVKYVASTGVFTESTAWNAGGVTTPGTVTVAYFPVTYLGSSYNFIGFDGYQPGTGSSQVSAYLSVDGTTWVGPYGMGISTHTAVTGGGLLLASNGTLLLAVTTSGNVTQYSTSTTSGGGSWTVRNLPAFNSGESPSGLIYDSVSGLFYLTLSTIPGASAATRLFSSPDGITWTLVSSTSGYGIYGIASDGPLLIGVGVSNSGNTAAILCSVNKGVTWRWTQLRGVANTGAVRSSGSGQFIYSDTGNIAASSTQVDLPAPVVTMV